MAVIKINLSGHENDILKSEGYIFPGALHVDLADEETPNRVASFLATLNVSSGDVVHLATPGLSALTYIVACAIHGMTGQFAHVQFLIRQPDGSYAKGPLFDGQAYRNDVARSKHRADVVVL